MTNGKKKENENEISPETVLDGVKNLGKRLDELGKRFDKSMDTIAHSIPAPSKIEHTPIDKTPVTPKTEYVIPPMNAVLNHVLECPDCYPKVEKAVLEKHKDRFVSRDQVPKLEGMVKLDDLRAAEFGCKDCSFPLSDPKGVDNCPMCGGAQYVKRRK